MKHRDRISRRLLGAGLAVLLALAGCASGPNADPRDPRATPGSGHFDDSNTGAADRSSPAVWCRQCGRDLCGKVVDRNTSDIGGPDACGCHSTTPAQEDAQALSRCVGHRGRACTVRPWRMLPTQS